MDAEATTRSPASGAPTFSAEGREQTSSEATRAATASRAATGTTTSAVARDSTASSAAPGTTWYSGIKQVISWRAAGDATTWTGGPTTTLCSVDREMIPRGPLVTSRSRCSEGKGATSSPAIREGT